MQLDPITSIQLEKEQPDVNLRHRIRYVLAEHIFISITSKNVHCLASVRKAPLTNTTDSKNHSIAN